MIPNTMKTKTRQRDCFLTMQESHIPQFITVITEVSKLLVDSMCMCVFAEIVVFSVPLALFPEEK